MCRSVFAGGSLPPLLSGDNRVYIQVSSKAWSSVETSYLRLYLLLCFFCCENCPGDKTRSVLIVLICYFLLNWEWLLKPANKTHAVSVPARYAVLQCNTLTSLWICNDIWCLWSGRCFLARRSRIYVFLIFFKKGGKEGNKRTWREKKRQSGKKEYAILSLVSLVAFLSWEENHALDWSYWNGLFKLCSIFKLILVLYMFSVTLIRNQR